MSRQFHCHFLAHAALYHVPYGTSAHVVNEPLADLCVVACAVPTPTEITNRLSLRLIQEHMGQVDFSLLLFIPESLENPFQSRRQKGISVACCFLCILSEVLLADD